MFASSRPLLPIGFETISSGRLHVPPKTSIIRMTCVSGDVRWRDDGVDPDINTGHQLHDKHAVWYNGDPTKLRFTGAVSITYYRP